MKPTTRASGAKVISVNVGRPRTLTVRGNDRVTAIFKEPVKGAVSISGVTVGDDVQMDKKHHGGEFKAVYVYAMEDYEWWEDQLGRELAPGTFGDNITTGGLEVNAASIGERWQVGTSVLDIPRFYLSSRRPGGRGG